MKREPRSHVFLHLSDMRMYEYRCNTIVILLPFPFSVLDIHLRAMEEHFINSCRGEWLLGYTGK